TPFYNLGRREMSGYELAFNYALPELAAGQFEVDVALSQLATFKVGGAGGSLVDIAGGYDYSAGMFFSTGALPKTRGAVGLSWARGPWSAASQYNFMSSYSDLSASGERIDRKIPFYATANFQVAYELGGTQGRSQSWLPMNAVRLTLGVQNAFDREVPFLVVVNGYNNYENDIRGRFVYARVAMDF
ncbi:TonB-dependent receptor, partial [Steroidobacter sp.]|uniref:TonB-dependent receptor n=1 Tax=Steroidobacter sp. TaxID=1978227 RepID=UPI001A4DF700